jgi:hypothetical protein
MKLCGSYDKHYGDPMTMYKQLNACDMETVNDQTYRNIKHYEKTVYQLGNAHLIQYIQPYQTLTCHTAYLCVYYPHLFQPERIKSTMEHILKTRRRFIFHQNENVSLFDFEEFEKICGHRVDIYDIVVPTQRSKIVQYAIIMDDMYTFTKKYGNLKDNTEKLKCKRLIVRYNRHNMLDHIMNLESVKFDAQQIFTLALCYLDRVMAEEFMSAENISAFQFFSESVDVVKSYRMAKEFGVEFTSKYVLYAIRNNMCDLLHELHADGVKLASTDLGGNAILVPPDGLNGYKYARQLWPEAFADD